MLRVDIFNLLVATAEPLYGAREAEQIARMILDEMGGVSTTSLILEPNAECEIEHLDTIVEELAAGRPVQYIIGEADFAGYRFKVREGVLIPRPETEELIFRVLEEATPSSRILDIGCGSGAIAISLAKSLGSAEVWGVDISEEALEIARENNYELGTNVNFAEADALEGVENYVDGEFDIVVSNPPYIPQSEIDNMRPNVVDFEPHLALFVEDDDPLIFYREIARSSRVLLKAGGLLYFEIHEIFGREMVDMLCDMGFKEVCLINDINDKARIVCAERGE